MIAIAPPTGEWLAGRRRALREMWRRLLEENAAAARELATPIEARGEDDTPSQHPADLASDLERRELMLSLTLIERRDLRDIEAAIERIDDGTYGTCFDCGRTIPRERLDVRPQAARDVECERRRERQHPRHASG